MNNNSMFFMIQESIQDWNMEYELWTSWYFATWFDPLQERTSLIRFLVQREIARGEGKSGLSPKYLLALHASSLYVPCHISRICVDRDDPVELRLTSMLNVTASWFCWKQPWALFPSARGPCYRAIMGSELAPATCNVGPVDVGDSNDIEFPQGWIVPCRLDIPIPWFFFDPELADRRSDPMTQWTLLICCNQKNHSHSPVTTIWGEFLETLLPRFYHPLAFWCLWNFRLCLSNDLFNPAAERWWKPRLSWRHFQGETPVDSEGGWWEQSPGQIQFLGRRCQKKRWKRKGGIKSTVQCMNTLLFGSHNEWNCPNDRNFRCEWCFSGDVQVFISSNRGCSSQKVAFCVLKCRNDCKMQGYLDIPLNTGHYNQWLWIKFWEQLIHRLQKKHPPSPVRSCSRVVRCVWSESFPWMDLYLLRRGNWQYSQSRWWSAWDTSAQVLTW